MKICPTIRYRYRPLFNGVGYPMSRVSCRISISGLRGLHDGNREAVMKGEERSAEVGTGDILQHRLGSCLREILRMR